MRPGHLLKDDNNKVSTKAIEEVPTRIGLKGALRNGWYLSYE